VLRQHIKHHISAYIGLGAAVLCLILFGADSFLIFSEKRTTPAFIQYIGKYLPSAAFVLGLENKIFFPV
jgi:branched-subunit amino acid transport protein AzlD